MIVDEDMIDGAHDRDTFRPVSILDGGLDINENDMNYDMNRGLLGGTINGDFCRATFYERDPTMMDGF